MAEFVATDGDRWTTREGTTDLAWRIDGEGDASFELQQSADGAFTAPVVRYRGSDSATFISGLAAGTHHFRVRAVGAAGEPGPWSGPVVVEVRYADRRLVTVLMLVGTIVFTATVGVIVKGSLDTRDTAPPEA